MHLHTVNKLPRRTAQVPARRPGITTGFSQAFDTAFALVWFHLVWSLILAPSK